jgi:GT2 family glycosyltransferase
MNRIAVAVVSYNTRELLRSCLASAVADRPLEIVVVDNGSTDGSVAMVRADFPGVTLVDDGGNIGYGAASNLAFSRINAEYVLLLNADTRVQPGALDRLTRYLDAHPKAAVVGPKLLNDDGSLQASCFPFPGTLGWLVENDPVAPVIGAIPFGRQRTLRYAPPTASTEVPWVLGAALAIRRSAFEEVGGFDRAFFMYFEEVDLCRRLSDVGWQIHFCPDAEVTHVGQASTRQVKGSMLVAHYRSTVLYYRRHLRGAALAFWLGVMRVKMNARIARDSVALALRPADRPALRESLAAWRTALRESP